MPKVLVHITQQERCFTKLALRHKKAMFFEWLDCPPDSRLPKSQADVEKKLCISHITLWGWKKEYKTLERLGERQKKAVQSRDIAVLLTQKLVDTRPNLDNLDNKELEHIERKDLVEASLWWALAKATLRLAKAVELEEKTEKLADVVTKVGNLLMRVDAMALARAGSLRKEVTRHAIVREVGSLVEGIDLPPEVAREVASTLALPLPSAPKTPEPPEEVDDDGEPERVGLDDPEEEALPEEEGELGVGDDEGEESGSGGDDIGPDTFEGVLTPRRRPRA